MQEAEAALCDTFNTLLTTAELTAAPALGAEAGSSEDLTAETVEGNGLDFLS